MPGTIVRRTGRRRRAAVVAVAVFAAPGAAGLAAAHPLAYALAAVPVGRTTNVAPCPLKPSSKTPTGEAWAFTVTGTPSTPHHGISSSYAHGRGAWTSGRGRGTICRQDSGPGHTSLNLVLTVAGRASISPGVTRLGRRGVELVLRVTVSASDDERCLPGARGTVTLFASYYQGHHDSVQFRLPSGCAAYGATYLGAQVHALIARNGHQVNAA
jgi:hypothetical protein